MNEEKLIKMNEEQMLAMKDKPHSEQEDNNGAQTTTPNDRGGPTDNQEEALSSDDGFEDTNNKSADNNSEGDKDQNVNNSVILEHIRKRIPPPNALFPKSYLLEDQSAQTGSLGKMFLLRRFKGSDRKADLMNQDYHIAGIDEQYQQNITLYKIFNPYDQNGDLKEEIVYYRDIGVDQNKALTIAEVNKNGNLFNTNKLDVKRLLKHNVSASGK